MDNLFTTNRIAFSGMKATRNWMNCIANNIANAQTLDSGVIGKDGNYIPYARRIPVFARVLSDQFHSATVNGDVVDGVAVNGVAELKGDVKKVYDPTNPAARRPGTSDAGYVYYPSISIAQEMADLKMASAAYEANMTVMAQSDKMTQNALRIGRSI